MFSRRHLAFQIFALAFIAAMFFPRVLPEGMFPDGLTYAAIARNMAEGRGSFWSPYFSSSFWIPFKGTQYEFYGHPTLAMGLQSLLFHIFGDHWFIEKFYNILIWLISIGLVIKLWQQTGCEKQLWWLPVLVWYMMPAVLWSYPNFVLDNTMAAFSIGSALLIQLGIRNEELGIKQIVQLVGAGLLLHLAFLTKGPVGLFPLAIPLIYWFIYDRKQGFLRGNKTKTLQHTIFKTIILSITCFGTLALWYFYEPARHFWQKYFEIQLVSSISENDQTEIYTILDYFYIPKELLVQSVALAIAGLVIFIFSKVKKTGFIFEKTAHQKALFFTLIALSGSLPMMISHKASAYFLLPALPFLVVGFCLWLEPTVLDWIEKFKLSAHKSLKINIFVSIVAISVVVYCLLQIGRVGRETELIHDLKILRGPIPESSKVCVPDSLMRHFNYHAYFQRYNRWELAKLSDTTAQFFIDELGVCRPSELDSAKQVWGFKPIEMEGLTSFRFYKKD